MTTDTASIGKTPKSLERYLVIIIKFIIKRKDLRGISYSFKDMPHN